MSEKGQAADRTEPVAWELLGGRKPTATPPAPAAAPPAEPMLLERTAVVVFLLFWAAWMGTLTWLWTHYPDLDHGDNFSDAGALISGRNFDTHGFGFNWGSPQWYRFSEDPNVRVPYTHSPPVPNWILQALKAAGLRELWQFRIAPLTVAGATGLLVLLVMSRLSGSGLIGALAGFFYMACAPFAEYADSLYQHTYMQATLFGFLASWIAFERARTPGRRALWLVVAAVLFFVDCWVVFEHILFITLFASGRLLLLRKRAILRGWVVVVLVPFVAVTTRLAHNSLALGGVGNAVRDMYKAAERRGGHGDEGVGFRELAETWHKRFWGKRLHPNDYDYPFQYPLLRAKILSAAGVLAIILLATWHLPILQAARAALGNSLLLLVAGGAWFVLMRDHSLVHRHLVMLALPGMALLLAALAGCGILQVRTSGPRLAPIRWAGPLVGLFLLAAFAWSMRHSMALNRLMDLRSDTRAWVVAKRQWCRRVAGAADALAEARGVLIIGTRPVLAYLAGRPFEFMETDRHRELRASEILWVQVWGPSDLAVARRAFERYGFPDMLTHRLPAPGVDLVFHASAKPRPEINVPFEQQYRISDMRLVSSLDGESWIVQSKLQGAVDDSVCHDLVIFCHVLDSAGAVVHNADTKLSWAIRGDKRALVWNVIPKTQVPPGGRLKIGLWRHSNGKNLSVIPKGVTLPAGAEVGPDKDCILWRPVQWRQ